MADEQQEKPPRGTERWKYETKGIERVIDVALTLESPQTAGWIAEEALVSEQTAREHLDLFTDLGVIATTTARGVTKYQPDAAFIRFKEVSARVERHSREQLLDGVEHVKGEIEHTEETYGVTDPDELRAQAAADEVTVEEIHEYRNVASEWETLDHDLDIMQEALERYAEFDRAVAST